MSWLRDVTSLFLTLSGYKSVYENSVRKTVNGFGVDAVYTNWGNMPDPTDENEYCVVMSREYGWRWNYASCETAFYFIASAVGGKLFKSY